MIYDWSKDSLPTIYSHSVNKLELIRGYYERYLEILGKSGIRNTFPLCLIDGFSGGGLYQTENGKLQQGSPILTLKAAFEFEASLDITSTSFANQGSFNFALKHTRRKVVTNFRFIFIDNNEKALGFLKDQVEKFKREHPLPKHWIINCYHGEFESLHEKVIRVVEQHSKSKRAIFFLDQYGYAEVKIPTIRKILYKLPKSEVIYIISTDWLIDKSSPGQMYTSLINLGCNPQNVTSFISRCESLSSNNEPKATLARQKRKLCQEFVKSEITASFSSKLYHSPYIIKSPQSHKSYVILHLAHSLKAKEAMLEQHWDKRNDTVHEGSPGLATVGYDASGASYLFQDEDKEKSEKVLSDQLCKLINNSNPQSALDLFRRIANDIPVPKDVVYDVLKNLNDLNEISATTQKGNKVSKVQDNTIIDKSTSKMKYFFDVSNDKN